MTKYLLLIILFAAGTSVNCQTKNGIQIELNYGYNFNPSADNFFEINNPPNNYSFSDKNTSGTISGLELRFPISNTMSVGLAYDRSIHQKTVSFMPSNIPIYIDDFKIRNLYNYYQFIVQKDFKKVNHIFSISTGLYYQRVAWQDIGASTRGIGLETRTFKNDRLEEGGAILGLQYSKKIDPHFYLGIRSRIYSTLSSGANIDGISFTPILTYHFK